MAFFSVKIGFHEGTIARNEKEVVYFVFDEMRDYCLARQILLNNVSAYYVDGESVIEKLKQLKASGASCAEGVIHYCYVFFKTDELVSKLEQTEKCAIQFLIYTVFRKVEKESYIGVCVTGKNFKSRIKDYLNIWSRID